MILSECVSHWAKELAKWNCKDVIFLKLTAPCLEVIPEEVRKTCIANIARPETSRRCPALEPVVLRMNFSFSWVTECAKSSVLREHWFLRRKSCGRWIRIQLLSATHRVRFQEFLQQSWKPVVGWLKLDSHNTLRCLRVRGNGVWD